MRTATEWFEHYGQSHTNPINKAIHWVCIPLIVVSTLGLLHSVPHPFPHPAMSWATLTVLASLGFYLRLSPTIFAGMAVVSSVSLGIVMAIANAGLPLATISAAVFFVAWLAQFVGHRIEGEKPSFFEDLQFLLVGPAWLLQFVYRKVGIPVDFRADASPAQ
ncbi:MAG: Mpo1-like protein [Myxococcota bacterium]